MRTHGSQSSLLSSEQIQFFNENGYLTGLDPLFSADAVSALNHGFDEAARFLSPDQEHLEIRAWHETSRFLFDICMNPRILDYVEALLGTGFFLWDSHFYIKKAQTNRIVGWHQDTHFTPFDPALSITACIALEDRNERNGDLRIIPRSHRAGKMSSPGFLPPDSITEVRCEHGVFATSTCIPLNLTAGGIAFHDDRIIHGSSANQTNRRRIGFNIRYAPNQVKCDLSQFPRFKTYPCRGIPLHQDNPRGTIPVEQFAPPPHS